ncbi:hypothetical protein [Micromonospora craniellae]|uniref:Carboxypeptidase regulatory-like domain-containing protein n=1 Tax=Micromonospora craniellae TaxID=2294034 RepID=A0A372FV49_9ACTN|nr:hypothetical protein [Micromonospora craniellae]QOC92427.1 hypothetical protein ID554_01100 [Micromonospora craniellae]RFS44578.1 hypothetical protein D0Q02_21265 [Micromonospora craniellae]
MSPSRRHAVARTAMLLTALALVAGAVPPLPATAGPRTVTATTGEVRTTVRDAATGADARACLALVPVDRDPLTVVFLGEEQLGRHGGCTGVEGGAVHITNVTPGRYRLLADPYDISRHGLQWVGVRGGKGQRERAAVITVRAGRTVTAPAVRLDPPGTVTGRMTRTTDGTPVSGGYAAPMPSVPHPKYGSPGAISDDDGRYTLTGLGPYQWPLYFTGNGLASQWSGGTGDRRQASTVRVRAGRTVTLDQALTSGTALSGTVTAPDISHYAQVVAFHARTGDVVGVADAGSDYTLRLLPGQRVVLRCDCVYAPSRWYPNADGIGGAQSLRVRATPLTADFDLTGPAAP